MFDGTYTSASCPPAPPQPGALDVRAVLPLLRAQAAEEIVAFLARAAADNALTVARWLALNWGPDADLRDHNHPAHVAALDPGSPPAKLAEARDALSTACWRYRVTTGCDGLALAHQVIVQAYGPRVADYTLEPLTTAARDWRAVDDALMQDGPEPLPPEPDPTPAERQAGAAAMAEWMLSEPGLDRVRRSLPDLLVPTDGAAGGVAGRPNEATVAAVGEAIKAALDGGADPEILQAALDWWSQATGGPQIRLDVVGASRGAA